MCPAARDPKKVASLIRDVHAQIKPLGGSKKGAEFLVRMRHRSLAEIRQRIKLMADANVHIGTILALSLPRGEFENLAARKSAEGVDRLLPKQKQVYGILTWSGMDHKRALELASFKDANLGWYTPRFNVLEQKIDQKKYGVGKLPGEVFPLVLHLNAHRLGRFIRAAILPVIENANAARILDVAFPSWRKTPQIFGKISPRVVLAKFEFLVEAGVVPYGKHLRQYSLEELKTVAPSLQKLNPALQKWMLGKLKEARQGGLSEGQQAALLEELKQVKVWQSIFEARLKKAKQEEKQNRGTK